MFKKTVRELMLRKRKSYSPQYIKDKSTQIKNRLFTQFDFNKVKILHIFLPIVKKKEIDTFTIINEIFAKYENTQLIVPVVDFNNKNLLHKFYHSNSPVSENKYGVMEPTNSELFHDLGAIDMVLVPLLSFDVKGSRVGYGGGYYDKFLPECCNAKKIGLSFEGPIEVITDVHDFDCKLDYCITPDGTYCFTQ